MVCRHLWKHACFLFGSAIVIGCAVGPTHQNLKTADLPSLITAHTFFQSSGGYWRLNISPDGSMVAYKGRSNGQPVIMIKKAGADTRHFVRTLHHRSVDQIYWMPNSHQVVFTQKINAKTQHVFLADINGGFPEPIDLTPKDDGKLQIVHIGHQRFDAIWITDYHRKYAIELRRIDIGQREEERVQTGTKEIISWIMDDHDQLRAGIFQAPDLSQHLDIFNPEKKSWEQLMQWQSDESVNFVDFGPQNKTMWLLSNHNRETVCLVRIDLETGNEELIYQDPTADILDVKLSRKNRKPIVAYSYPDYPKTHFFDTTYEKCIKPFTPDKPHGLYIAGSDQNEDLIGFTVYTDKNQKAYLYHRPTGRIEFWADSVMTLRESMLAAMRPISFQSRDGLTLKGYLTLPKGVRPVNLPTVLLVHGGPWAQDYWEYDRLVQFLANRGYAVLQINYRGSTGYGKSFMRKGIGEFAGKMHDDLVDGILWVIDQGYTDPNNIAIMGWSYGGYAALVGLTFTPDLFNCAIAIAGISDLTTHYSKKIDDLSEASIHFVNTYVGNPQKDADRERMKTQSPLTYVDRITRPLLIMHGGEDTIVSSTESDQMVEAMRKAGKEVDYVFFPDEGHSFEKWESWSLLFRKVETFLAAHLGGRSETRLSERYEIPPIVGR